MNRTLSIIAALMLTFTMVNCVPEGALSASAYDNSLVASASQQGSVVLDANTGVLTIRGNITSKDMVCIYRDNDKVTSIVAEEGSVFPEDCSYMFGNPDQYTKFFKNIRSIDISKADTSKVTNMEGMFGLDALGYDYRDLETINVSGIDTSNVTNMSNMFRSIRYVKELDVSSFDTSKVTDMNHMFYACLGIENLDLSNFDTSNVLDMSYMIADCVKLETVDVTGFDTSKVTKMSMMFCASNKIKELDLSSFDTSSVLADSAYNSGFFNMFNFCDSLQTIYTTDKFVVNDGVVTESMFGPKDYKDGCPLTGGNGTKWNKDHTDGEYARIDREGQPGYFTYKAPAEGSVSLNKSTGVLRLRGKITKEQVLKYKDNENVTSIVAEEGCVFPEDCSYMFADPTFLYFPNIRSIDISKADTSNVKTMEGMFAFGATDSVYRDLKNINVSGIDTSNVTNMNSMFYGLTRVEDLDLSSFDTSNVTDMSYMFYNCTRLKALDVSNFDTSKVTDMSYLFYNCREIKSIDVSNFDTSNVTSMKAMFRSCKNLEHLDVTSFDTSMVKNMGDMFNSAAKLTELDLSSFDTSAVMDEKDGTAIQGFYGMFFMCHDLNTIYVSEKFVINDGANTKNMFNIDNADDKQNITGGNGTKWDKENVNGEYARIDRKGQPGYFTFRNNLKPTKLADVSADDKIDIEDAAIVIAHINGNAAMSDAQLKFADIDGNNNVDIEDVVAIISHVNGLKPIDM